jgi:hypothetical protein
MKKFKTFLESRSEADANRYLSSNPKSEPYETANAILDNTKLSLEPEKGREWIHPSYAKTK